MLNNWVLSDSSSNDLHADLGNNLEKKNKV